MKSCYGQRDRMSRGGMSPLRLFTRSNAPPPAPGKSETVECCSSGVDGRPGPARQPLCPITEAARKPLAVAAVGQCSEDICAPEGEGGEEKPSLRAKGKCSCIVQEKFPHLENSEGIVNSVSLASAEKNAALRVLSSLDGVNLTSNRNKFTWQRRQGTTTAQTNARDGFSNSSTPPRASASASASASTSCAVAVVSQEVACGGQCSGTQLAPAPGVGEREGQSGGRTPFDTPKFVRTPPEGRSTFANEATTGSSHSRTATPGNNVSRALKYSQQQATSGMSGATGPADASSACLQNAVALPSAQLEGFESVLPQSVNHSFAEQHFELEEDASFWREHNVQVLIRIRPINAIEFAAQGRNRCLKQESPHTLCWLGQPESRFTFDHVVGETVTQARLFEVAGLPVVENCMSGYNSCIFAYGQTGSGKTHTMLGDVEDLDFSPSQNRGMTPRVFEYLFDRIRMEQETRRQEHLKFSCKCSFLEIYNEQVADLLEPSSTNLQMREDAKKGVHVENLLEVEVQGVKDIIQLILQGTANRRVAATNMNRESSRSHSVFTCVVESKWEANCVTNSRYGRLHLVDLAGSERQKSSGAEGGRLRESANINKSLSTLGLVIMILVDVANGKQRHVPYRDSKLTFLLQDSLGGNSKTIMIANISPSSCCAMETLSTLKFAQRAKFIRNNAVINEDASGDVNALRQQIEDLKVELHRLRHGTILRTTSSVYLAQQLLALEENGDKTDESATLDSFEIGRSSLDVTCKFTTASTLNSDKNSESAQELMQGEQLTKDKTTTTAAENGENDECERFESKDGAEDEDMRIAEPDHKLKRPSALNETSGRSLDFSVSAPCDNVLGLERSRMDIPRRGRRAKLQLTQPLVEVPASKSSLEESSRPTGKMGPEKKSAHELNLRDDVNDAAELKLSATSSKSTIDSVDEVGFNVITVDEEALRLTEGTPTSARRILKQRRLRDERLRAEIREKDMKILSGRKDIEAAMANLKEAELEIGKVHTDKGRLTELLSENRTLISRVSSKLKGTEDELWNRGMKIERCEAELRKMAVILYDWEIKMHDVEKLKWRKENQALAEELTKLKVNSSAKSGDAAYLRQDVEEKEASLKQSSVVVNAIVTESGNDEHGQTEDQTILVGEGLSAPELLAGMDTDLRTQQEDMWVNCRDALVSLVETMDGFSTATREISAIWNSHHQEMEQMRTELDAWKGDLVARYNLPAVREDQMDQLIEANCGHDYSPRDFRSENFRLECSSGIAEATKDLTCEDLEMADNDVQLSVSPRVAESNLPDTKLKDLESLGTAHDSGSDVPRVAKSPFEATIVSPDVTIDLLKSGIGDSRGPVVNALGAKFLSTRNALLFGNHIKKELLFAHKEDPEDCLRTLVFKKDASSGQVDRREEHEAPSDVGNFQSGESGLTCSIAAACVSDLLTLKRVFCIEAEVIERLMKKIKAMRELDRTKMQNSVDLMGTQGGVHSGWTRASYQTAVVTDELRELEMVVNGVQADVNNKKDGVCKALELVLDQLERGEDGGKYFVSTPKRRGERISLLMRLQEASKEFQRPCRDICRQGRDNKPESDDDNLAWLKQATFFLPCGEAENDELLHDDNCRRDRPQTLRQAVAEFEQQCKVPPENATEESLTRCKGNDELSLLPKAELIFLIETLMGALAICETFVSELPDLLGQCNERCPTLHNLGEVSEEFQIIFQEVRADVANFRQVAEGERDQWSRRMHLADEENKKLTAELQHLQSKISSLRDDLEEKRLTEILAEDLLLDEQNTSHALQMMNDRLKAAEGDREKIQKELLLVNEQLDVAERLADERAVVTNKARRVAELSILHAEEKEEEARILGRSVEELESTVYVLESQLGIVNGEVERQRAAREMLEKDSEYRKQEVASLQAKVDSQQAQILKDAYHAGTAKTELDRIVIEMKAQQFHTRRSVECLQQECAEKDVQLRSCKAHIADLMLGAEKQASENHLKLKTLESMAEKFRLEDWKSTSGSVGKVVEKLNPNRGRRPGSPFRCLSSGLQQPRTSDLDEDLSAAKKKIKELEAGAASRQKEIFMLNTKLAEAESMTHDVVRDLLGVKTDITSYATLLTQHQKQQMPERARFRTFEAQQLPAREAGHGCGCSSVR